MNLIPIYTKEQVDEALDAMANRIRLLHIESVSTPLVLVSILKGGVWTAYQLLNRLSGQADCPDIRIGHMGISSYGHRKEAGPLKTTYTLDLDLEDIQGSQVIVVDDIWDTGSTMSAALKRINAMNPREVYSCTLVWRRPKQDGSIPELPNICGLTFEGTQFLAGCGMGFGERYRHHSSIFAEGKENGSTCAH